MDMGVIENIIKSTHIFNDIKVASKPHVCKILPKLDMAIIWVDIWDLQNGSLAKKIINRSFNIGSFITTVRSANMNPSVSQCKNCWKWEHTTFTCYFQGSWCVKCNSLHQSEHHHHFGWCCKANFKINPSYLETKQGELCLHIFKCINCKGNHQADFNACPF